VILAACLGGLGLIVWWRVGQAHAAGVPYMDKARGAALLGVGIIVALWLAVASYAIRHH
jgi:hypothetical protein